MFRLDQGKIMGLRVDTLSQVITAVNLQPNGKFILFESGCQGLVAATMLNSLSAEGRLVLVHPGNYPQKQAVLALNLTEEQENCLICVNIYNLLRRLKTDDSCNSKNVLDPQKTSDTLEELKAGDLELFKKVKSNTMLESENILLSNKDATSEETLENNSKLVESEEQFSLSSDQENSCPGKRKHSECGIDEGSAKKKSRWEVETDKAARTLSTKADGLVLVAREHPSTILKALLPLLAPSRTFVVYSQFQEPLQELFLELREQANIINLKLTDTWLRNYQVESNRTHPLVNMTGSGGFLLTGVLVNNSKR